MNIYVCMYVYICIYVYVYIYIKKKKHPMPTCTSNADSLQTTKPENTNLGITGLFAGFSGFGVCMQSYCLKCCLSKQKHPAKNSMDLQARDTKSFINVKGYIHPNCFSGFKLRTILPALPFVAALYAQTYEGKGLHANDQRSLASLSRNPWVVNPEALPRDPKQQCPGFHHQACPSRRFSPCALLSYTACFIATGNALASRQGSSPTPGQRCDLFEEAR